MWHSLPDGVAPPLGASARLWLSKPRRKSVHHEGMPTSHSICSPGVRFQLAFELGKQKALRQRGRRNELSLPSASPQPPGCSLVCNFISGVSKGESLRGCAALAQGPTHWSLGSGSPKGEGSCIKACDTAAKSDCLKKTQGRGRKREKRRQTKVTFFPKNSVS